MCFPFLSVSGAFGIGGDGSGMVLLGFWRLRGMAEAMVVETAFKDLPIVLCSGCLVAFPLLAGAVLDLTPCSMSLSLSLSLLVFTVVVRGLAVKNWRTSV